MSCAFCKREVKTRDHHLVPRCRGGRETVPACESCESFIHSAWSHNELRDTYNTVEAILANEGFQRFLSWLLKQKHGIVFRTTKSSTRNRRKYS